jgi:hypothetical protein
VDDAPRPRDLTRVDSATKQIGEYARAAAAGVFAKDVLAAQTAP